MSYGRFGTPKIYVDNLNWLLSLGKNDISNFSFTSSGSVALASGSSVPEMFDMKPSNLQTISCNGASDDLFISIDTGITSDDRVDNNFIAILGHNLHQAGASFRIQQSDSSNFVPNYNAESNTEIVNAVFSSPYFRPNKNGWSLATFADNTASSANNRYWRINIIPSSSTYSSDIKIGAILMGETISLPHSPDLEISKTFSYEGVTRQTSTGGQTYANAQYLSGANWFLDPFNLSTDTSPNSLRKTGRQLIDMKFSYLTDTDVYPETLYSDIGIIGGNDFVTNMINKTHGGMFPFIFQYDNTLTDGQDSFLWCRLNNEPKFQQVAQRIWNTSIELIEEF